MGKQARLGSVMSAYEYSSVFCEALENRVLLDASHIVGSIVSTDPSPLVVRLPTGGGTTATIQTQVSIAPGPGALDVFFLADTTGSMGSYIDSLRTGFRTIAQDLIAALPGVDLHMGVAEYRDFEDGGVYAHGISVSCPLVGDLSAVQTALNGWSPGGGGDMPEQNLAALGKLAEGWETLYGGRSLARRIVVMAGDEPGWENGAKGLAYPALQATIDALVAQGISVFALSNDAAGYGIDAVGPASTPDHPTDGRHQASTLATATGGTVFYNVNFASPTAVVSTVVSAIGEQAADINAITLIAGDGSLGAWSLNITGTNTTGPFTADDSPISSTFTLSILAPAVADTREVTLTLRANGVPLATTTLDLVAAAYPVPSLKISPISTRCAEHTFTVTYQDSSGIRLSSIGEGDIRVRKGSAFSELARLLSITGADGDKQVTATYAITGPGGAWDATDNGSYEILMEAEQVANKVGNFAHAGSLGTLTTSITDVTPPTAALDKAPPIQSRTGSYGGGNSYEFTVVYRDNVWVRRASLDGDDLRVRAPNGTLLSAAFISSTPGTNATPLVATYRINAPGGAWDRLDNGSYRILLQEEQVFDSGGNPVPAADLGSFTVSILHAQPLEIYGTANRDTILLSQAEGVLTVSLNGETSTYLVDEVSALSIYGLAKADLIRLEPSVTLAALIKGQRGADSIYGGSGNDTLRGGRGPDLIVGRDGNDALRGNAGSDTLRGGTGQDSLYGGYSEDLLAGGADNDTLVGGDAADILRGGAGDDFLFGIDRGADLLNGGTGHDRFRADAELDQLLSLEELVP